MFYVVKYKVIANISGSDVSVNLLYDTLEDLAHKYFWHDFTVWKDNHHGECVSIYGTEQRFCSLINEPFFYDAMVYAVNQRVPIDEIFKRQSVITTKSIIAPPLNLRISSDNIEKDGIKVKLRIEEELLATINNREELAIWMTSFLINCDYLYTHQFEKQYNQSQGEENTESCINQMFISVFFGEYN